MSIKKVTVIGGNGKLGPSIIEALTQAQTFEITILTRSSSKSTYLGHIKQAKVSDSMHLEELTDALRGQDALVIAIAGTNTSTSLKLAEAAYEAGVKRIIPADYGSCDSSDPRSLDLVPLYKEKEKVRNYLTDLSTKSNGSLTWTSLITGHFLDYGLSSGLLQLDLRKKTGRTFDGGNARWSATTLAGIASAVTKILQHEDETKNKLLYVQSVSTTQNELLKIVENVMDAHFEIEHINSEKYIAENKAKLKANPKDADATEELVSVEGVVNGNWEGREGFANELLGMPVVDLETVVRDVVAKL